MIKDGPINENIELLHQLNQSVSALNNFGYFWSQKSMYSLVYLTIQGLEALEQRNVDQMMEQEDSENVPISHFAK